jgi:hypothetical protein
MSIKERVQGIVSDAVIKRSSDPTLKESQEFVKQKQAEGVVQKQIYSLPPIDTVGERRHQMMAHRAESTSKA